MRGYKEERRKEGMASRMRHFLHGRGRRFCAAIMCVSLLAGNVFTSIGASVTETAEFKIEQEDLKAALQKAVDKKRTEKAEFEFKGEEADRYAELFDTEDGTLYKLSPDVSKENGSGLSLSIYARLTDEFEKEDSEDTYEITGDEEIIFLLKNGSAKEKKAVIYVGDQCTDVITVVPGSSIKVEEETPANLLEEETVPDADEMEDGAGTAPSGNGGDSSTTGEISESDASDESNAADPTEESNEGEKDSDSNIIVIEPDKTNPEEKNDDVKVDTDVEIIDKKEENENTSDKTEAGEEKDSEDTSASNGTEAGAEQSDSTSKPEDNKADESADTSGTEKEENKTTDTASDDKAESEKSEPEKKSHDNASDDNSDTKSDDSSDAGEEKIAAAISDHYVVRVAAVNKEEEEASPSDALPEKSETEENEADKAEKIEEENEEDEEEASPSEATPSELCFDMEGEVLEAVRLGDNGAVAFVTTADALDLDDIIYKVELDKVTVRVAADRGVLPENVALAVDELLPEGDTAAKYEEAETALKEAGTEYSGMMALDIRFLDENEAEVEPNGNVKVAIEMRPEFFPENVNHDTVAIQHIAEDENGGIQVNAVADTEDVTEGIVEKKETEMTIAEFKVESFSTFTVTFNTEIASIASIEILDNIKTTGTLDPVINQNADFYKEAGKHTITLQWYRNGETNPIQVTKVSGEDYNVSATGKLNVALDIEMLAKTDSSARGKQYSYRVEAYLDENTENKKSSGSYTVPYYAELRNGDFETPGIPNKGNYQPNYDSGGEIIWKTTASDKKIEVISADPNKTTATSNWGERSTSYQKLSIEHHKCPEANGGTQYAELNANEAGALYQDVLTVPGSNLHWQLAHRARGDSEVSYWTNKPIETQYDTMYVLIMPTKLAEEKGVDTQSKVEEIIQNVDEYKNQGVFVQEIKSDNQEWHQYSGNYTVNSGSYLTRFFFVSGETAFDVNNPDSKLTKTVGNHIDSVWFSPELPPPDPDKGNLTIRKIVNGLTAEDVKNYKVTITVEKSDRQKESYVLKDFTPNGDSTFTSNAIELQNVPIGKYIIEETTSILPENYRGPEVEVKNGSEPVAGENGKYTIQLNDGDDFSIGVTNKYSQLLTLTVQKAVAGNMGDKSKSFKFEAAIIRGGKNVTKELFAEVDSQSGKGVFWLKNDESFVINKLQAGDKIQIDEVGAEDYTTTITVTGNGSENTAEAPNSKDNKKYDMSEAGIKENTVVTFTNTKDITPPTGLFTTNTPYLLMLAFALCSMAAAFFYKRRASRA